MFRTSDGRRGTLIDVTESEALREILGLLQPLMDPEYCQAWPSAWELCPYTDARTASGERLDGERLHERLRAAYDRACASVTR